MRTLLCLLFLEAVMIFYISPVSGQVIMADYDSIAVAKPEINIPLYKFFYNGDHEIQHGSTNAELVHFKTNTILKDMGNGILTAITGIGFTTTTDGNWKVTSNVSSNDLLPDWTVNLFCEGEIEKNRERVMNDDGSVTVEKEEISIFYWDRNSNGIIIERNDTIGFFSIIMNPLENRFLESWYPIIFPEGPTRKNKNSGIKFSLFWRPEPGNDYGITGKLHERDFILLRNGTSRKILIITDNIPRCIFQSDLNYPGISRKYRIDPYFLIDPDISDKERSDIFRLAMVCKILDNSID